MMTFHDAQYRYAVCRDVYQCACSLIGKIPKPPFCRDLGTNMTAVGLLASFFTQVRGIKFYDVPTHHISVGDNFVCRLEPSSPFDTNSIIVCSSMIGATVLGHLAREAAAYLAPLLRVGFHASG